MIVVKDENALIVRIAETADTDVTRTKCAIGYKRRDVGSHVIKSLSNPGAAVSMGRDNHPLLA
jgi:hypothetical protein